MRILIVLLVILIVSCTWRPVMGQEDTKVFQKPVACKSIGTMISKLNEEGFLNIIRFMAAGNTQVYVYILMFEKDDHFAEPRLASLRQTKKAQRRLQHRHLTLSCSI